MPIPIHYDLPKPTNEYEFEDMVEDYFKLNYGDAQKYGRKGQKQYGLDIICPINQGKQVIGVQCKKYNSLSFQDIDNILDDIKGTPLSLTRLVIATTASTDAKIQNYILEKRKELQMDIQILFWENIRHVIARSHDLLQKYYPDIYNTQQSSCVTINDLVNKFNSCIQEYKILDFIKVDPFIGMPFDLPTNVDIFYNIMQDYLNYAITLQINNKFKAINEFITILDRYNGYLSYLMSPAGTNYYSFKNISSPPRRDEIKEVINNTKEELNKLYSIINEGCVLFF